MNLSDVEAVVLTGGQSRRMGVDKAAIPVHGVPIGERIVGALTAQLIPVTVLGPVAILDYPYLPDSNLFQGPLRALANFHPARPFCFVASCDLPGFDARIVPLLRSRIGSADAAIPYLGELLQPLCALYRASSWSELPAEERRVMAWVDKLDVALVREIHLAESGISPLALSNVNSQEDLDEFLQRCPAG